MATEFACSSSWQGRSFLGRRPCAPSCSPTPAQRSAVQASACVFWTAARPSRPLARQACSPGASAQAGGASCASLPAWLPAWLDLPAAACLAGWSLVGTCQPLSFRPLLPPPSPWLSALCGIWQPQLRQLCCRERGGGGGGAAWLHSWPCLPACLPACLSLLFLCLAQEPAQRVALGREGVGCRRLVGRGTRLAAQEGRWTGRGCGGSSSGWRRPPTPLERSGQADQVVTLQPPYSKWVRRDSSPAVEQCTSSQVQQPLPGVKDPRAAGQRHSKQDNGTA